MGALRHAWEESITSLWRGRRVAALGMLTIATAVFVLGGFLLVTVNLDRLAQAWRSAAELSVFLADDATEDDQRRIEERLAPNPVVAGYTFVSKADALVRFKEMFGDLSPAVDALGKNPLPASYEVRLLPSPETQTGLDDLASRLQQMPGVSDVRHDRLWLERLQGGVAVVRRAGGALSAILALAAALTATTVVRLALHARRDELEIMDLVGSPTSYVEGPFIMEGAAQGAIGGAVAVAALGGAFLVLRDRYLTPWAAALNLTEVHFLAPGTCGLLVCGATVVGCVAGLVAARSRG